MSLLEQHKERENNGNINNKASDTQCSSYCRCPTELHCAPLCPKLCVPPASPFLQILGMTSVWYRISHWLVPLGYHGCENKPHPSGSQNSFLSFRSHFNHLFMDLISFKSLPFLQTCFQLQCCNSASDQ